MLLKFSYPRINKANIHNNITAISSFQNGFSHHVISTSLYFKSKITEGSGKVKKYVLLTFGWFFSKCTFWGWNIFSRLVVILLNIRIAMVTKIVRVVTYHEDFPPINLHDTSIE